MNITLRVNGIEHHLAIDTRVSLLDLLREHLRLTGSKKGCNHGQCGACTVIVNGERINSCLALAVCHDGDEVTTVEGLANGNELHPLQAAFIRHDGFQCGYCTSGQICSAVAMLDEVRRNTVSRVTADVRQPGPVPLTAEEVRERMSGNLCRCGAYNGIIAAILEASGSIDRTVTYEVHAIHARALAVGAIIADRHARHNAAVLIAKEGGPDVPR